MVNMVNTNSMYTLSLVIDHLVVTCYNLMATWRGNTLGSSSLVLCSYLETGIKHCQWWYSICATVTRTLISLSSQSASDSFTLAILAVTIVTDIIARFSVRLGTTRVYRDVIRPYHFTSDLCLKLRTTITHKITSSAQHSGAEVVQ